MEIGKARIVRLPGPPDVIMLGNPAVADVVVEGRLYLLDREPGETNLLILNKAGTVILSAAIVVEPVRNRRVTVDRGPQSFTLSCNPRCSPVATPQGTGATTVAAAPTGDGASASGGPGEQTAGDGAATNDLASALSGLLGWQKIEQCQDS